MPKPEDVNHKLFPVSVDDVIYNDGDVSVAFSTWDKKDPALGVRWNGNYGDFVGSGGYPNSRGRPAWFIPPCRIAIATLRGLLETEFKDKDAEQMNDAIQKLDRHCPASG